MTDNIDADAEQFIALVRDNVPDKMTTETIIRVVGGLITDFSEDRTDAALFLHLLTVLVLSYYDQDPSGECMCPDCTAERKANAN